MVLGKAPFVLRTFPPENGETLGVAIRIVGVEFCDGSLKGAFEMGINRRGEQVVDSPCGDVEVSGFAGWVYGFGDDDGFGGIGGSGRFGRLIRRMFRMRRAGSSIRVMLCLRRVRLGIR